MWDIELERAAKRYLVRVIRLLVGQVASILTREGLGVPDEVVLD